MTCQAFSRYAPSSTRRNFLHCLLALQIVSVLSYHNDIHRTGQNLLETILTPANVSPATFGKLFSHPVDGVVYAQPLYVSNVAVPNNSTHNIVFVATENDSVYAFDADTNTGANAAALWHVSFVNPAAGITALSYLDVGTSDMYPKIGITGTPAIDPVSGTLYLVARTKEVTNGTAKYYQRLHALDIGSGSEKFGGPFPIHPAFPGDCSPNDGNGHIIFNVRLQNQRAGLALYNGLVYVTWASHSDKDPYNGWVVAYRTQAPATPAAIFNAAPNQGSLGNECRAGIWQGGAAPAIDAAGNLFLVTGNGNFNASTPGGTNYGDSILKLSLSGFHLNVADYFTPYDQEDLDEADTDLGAGGALLLPDQPGPNPHLLVVAGKSGTIYLINRDNMGKYNAGGDTQIVQSLPGAVGEIRGMAAYFNGMIYFGGEDDYLKAFKLTNGLLAASPVSQSGTNFSYPGTTPSVSANGSTNGIVWTLQNDAWYSGGPTILHAYNAANLGTELYNSKQNAARDQLGPSVKFSVPTIANGKVYVGTGNTLDVLGQL